MKASDIMRHPDLLRTVMAGLRLRMRACGARAAEEIERGDEEQAALWRSLGMRAQACHEACESALLKIED